MINDNDNSIFWSRFNNPSSLGVYPGAHTHTGPTIQHFELQSTLEDLVTAVIDLNRRLLILEKSKESTNKITKKSISDMEDAKKIRTEKDTNGPPLD